MIYATATVNVICARFRAARWRSSPRLLTRRRRRHRSRRRYFDRANHGDALLNARRRLLRVWCQLSSARFL